MIYYLLLTAFTVSIDSFVCGYSLSLTNKRKLPIVVCISLTVFLMCLITNYIPTLLVSTINERSASLGGIILIAIGVFNLLKIKKQVKSTKNTTLKQSFVIGFAVGLDGATANLSLSLMGINGFYVPVTIALFHAILIWLGTALSHIKTSRKFAKIEFIAPIILILLGCYKLLGLFI